jgi:hypothetical protein
MYQMLVLLLLLVWLLPLDLVRCRRPTRPSRVQDVQDAAAAACCCCRNLMLSQDHVRSRRPARLSRVQLYLMPVLVLLLLVLLLLVLVLLVWILLLDLVCSRRPTCLSRVQDVPDADAGAPTPGAGVVPAVVLLSEAGAVPGAGVLYMLRLLLVVVLMKLDARAAASAGWQPFAHNLALPVADGGAPGADAGVVPAALVPAAPAPPAALLLLLLYLLHLVLVL